jgi:hypothetical protein
VSDKQKILCGTTSCHTRRPLIMFPRGLVRF